MLNAKRGMRVVVLDATEMEETKTSGRAIEWRGMNTPNQTNAVMTEPPSPPARSAQTTNNRKRDGSGGETKFDRTEGRIEPNAISGNADREGQASKYKRTGEKRSAQ